MSYSEDSRRRDRIEHFIFLIVIGTLLFIFSVYYPQNCNSIAHNKATETKSQISDEQQNLEMSNGIWADIKSHPIDTSIAVFTMLLAVFTYQLVTDAKETSKRQLRAYLHINTASYLGDEERAHLEIKNFGNTPAKKVIIKTEAKFLNAIDKNAVLPFTEEAEIHPPITLPPQKENILNIPVIRKQYSKTQVVYVWGKIEYIDSFNERRFTTFQLFTPAGFGSALGYCEAGNDSD